MGKSVWETLENYFKVKLKFKLFKNIFMKVFQNNEFIYLDYPL